MVVIEERRWRRGVTRIDDPEVAALCPGCPAGSRPAPTWRVRSPITSRLGPGSVRRGVAEMAEPLARPLRRRFGLPEQAPADAVLCAVYHRIFVGE